MALDIPSSIFPELRAIAEKAGREIMAIYHSDFAVHAKDDASPVTEADRRAEALITAALKDGPLGDLPVVGEEAVAEGRGPARVDGPFWLVDPLDGTKEFVKHGTEFTVNIALIEAGRPVLGIVHLPATGKSFWGSAQGAFMASCGGSASAITCRPAPAAGIVAIASRSHRTPEIDTYLADFRVAREISAGSSMKFCCIAMGTADLYPRLGRTMEWDTAAGHAVLAAAGGHVLTLEGDELAYGKPGFENPYFAAFGGDPAALPRK